MRKILKFLATEILYNGHLQALGAVGIVYVSLLIAFGMKPGFDLLIIIYCVFQFIYYFDRYRDLKKDQATNKVRSAHIGLYKQKVPIIMFLLFVVVFLGNYFFGNLISLVSLLAVMFLGVLYPVYFKGLTKKIFMFKNFYVASVHAILVFFPMVYYSLVTLKTSVLIVLFFFVLIEALLSQIALDTKDIESDKREKLLTFPVVLGRQKAINLIKVGGFISLTSFFYIGIRFHLQVQFYAILLGTFILNEYIAFKIERQEVEGVLAAAAKFFLIFCLTLIVNIVL